MNIDRLLQQRQGGASIPPLDTWQPPLSGDMDIVIQADGSWLHDGQPFARPAIARLLSTLLRRDPEGYCLVTPVERWRIQVEDLPLIAVEADFHDEAWWLTTQFDDVIRLDEEHPLSISQTPQDEQVPDITVRYGLAARLHRHVFYQLVEASSSRDLPDGQCEIGIWSAGSWHALGRLDAEASDGPPSEVS